MYDLRLETFFDKEDENGVVHNGFLQSIDLNDYVDLTILNEITLNLMDAFIKNEIGKMRTMGRWNAFLNWDKEDHEFKILSDFYDSAKQAIYVYLVRSQRFFQLLNTNFSSLSATETEQIIYGQKEEQKDYDKVIVNVERENDSTQYGIDELTTQFGNTRKDLNFGNTRKDFNFGNIRKDFTFDKKETETEYGDTRKDLTFAKKETETEYGNTRKDIDFGIRHSETEYGNTREDVTTGQQTNTDNTTNQTRPFDLNAFLDDTANNRTVQNGTRSDSKTTNTHTDTIEENARRDTETNATHTDTETIKAHTDTETNATHTDTETVKARTDTETTATHTDSETENAHVDTETENAHTDIETRSAHTDVNMYGDITNTTDERTDTTTIKTHTDTKTRTKIILISPDKYFEIMKELYSYNVYDILLNAIKECFTIKAF